MKHLAIACIVVLAMQSTANATIEVLMNFDASWETNLATMTTAAGVTAFDAGEISTIESNIASHLNTMFSGLAVDFNTTSMATQHTINFGASGGGADVLGEAPFDVHNTFDTQTASVYVSEFDFILDEFSGSTSRATQIDQISTALAGTGAHELGHALGLAHHHAYHDPSIVPTTYSNTAAAQNSHIIATGSTGLDEIGRETLRHFSDFSKILLETTGGLAAFGGSSNSAVTTPLSLQDLVGGSDVGGSTGAATAMTMSTTSTVNQHRAGFLGGDLSNDSDVDVYSFATTVANEKITAQVWSSLSPFANDFNPIIRLFGTDGSTVLATNNDTAYDGNTFGSGSNSNLDSFLLNIIAPTVGIYYLEVASAGNINGVAGGTYLAVLDANNPEPGSVMLMLTAAAGAGISTWRRRRKQKNSDDAEIGSCCV